MSAAIAEPWTQRTPDPVSGRPITGGGWVCNTCETAVTTEGNWIAVPIPAAEAARRHNAARHPRRLARIEATS